MSDSDGFLDLSSAKKFFSDVVRVAYEQGRLSECSGEYLDLSEGSFLDNDNIVYTDNSNIILKRFFSKGPSEYHKSICNGYHKVFVHSVGNFSVNTGNNMVVVDEDRKIFYLKDGEDFDLCFFEDCWFYVLLIPS